MDSHTKVDNDIPFLSFFSGLQYRTRCLDMDSKHNKLHNYITKTSYLIVVINRGTGCALDEKRGCVCVCSHSHLWVALLTATY